MMNGRFKIVRKKEQRVTFVPRSDGGYELARVIAEVHQPSLAENQRGIALSHELRRLHLTSREADVILGTTDGASCVAGVCIGEDEFENESDLDLAVVALRSAAAERDRFMGRAAPKRGVDDATWLKIIAGIFICMSAIAIAWIIYG